tara:strand:- start:6430 stop:7362 length:933 start_codon:yes stop_codon:yes gene_type:complete
MKIFKPKFWDQNYFTILSLLLFPVSLLYRAIIYLKNVNSNQKEFSIPVICVGNIYVGGTGKTPISLKICKILKESDQNPVIIKKNYKNHNDEISLIKKYNKILVSKKRADAINQAIEKKFNFAVLDDGYQDLSVKKNLSIVCFHGKQKIGNGHLIPSGPLRENLMALKNCQTILINGKKDLEFEQKLKRYNSKLDFFYYDYCLKNIENFKNKKLIAFAGIGNPQNFFDFLKENHLNIVKEISYPDHYQYSEKDLENLNKLENLYKAKLITTEKDFLRINPFVRKKFDHIRIELKFENEESFKNKIKQLIK